jgi:predicted PhzF superfamily epimerase YddE/YHI9
MGVNEDPVTGSNHTVLAPYWGNILGKSKMRAYQASTRGGVIEVDGDRVNLVGRSVLVLEGKLRYA